LDICLDACGTHAVWELVERYIGINDHNMLDVAEDSSLGAVQR
jgi:mitochondrial chaperone BCS1